MADSFGFYLFLIQWLFNTHAIVIFKSTQNQKRRYRFYLNQWLQQLIKSMSSLQTLQPEHTKILQVIRSKNFKKSTKDSRNHLYFKIRPNNKSTELIVSYKDLKENFPYALIDFYEDRLKVTERNDDTQSINGIKDKLTKESSVSIHMDVKLSKNCKKSGQKQAQAQGQTKIVLQQNKQQDKSNKEAIYDYDKYLQDNPHSYKSFHALFSETESIQNRYLKDLRSEDVGYGRKGGREQVLDVKRKKPKVHYEQE